MNQPASGLRVSRSPRRTYLRHRPPPPQSPPTGRPARSRPALVDLVALCVALVALVMSFMAWTRPYPADPRNIPHHGDPVIPVELSNDAAVAEFFDFLEEEKEGRVYLNVAIPMDRADHHKLYLPEPGDPDPTEGFMLQDSFPSMLLQIRKTDEEGRRGIFFAHGAHHLKGYFANNGMVDISTGVAAFRITPLTDLEALSP